MSNHQHPESGGRRPNWSSINQWLLWIGLAAAVAWLVFGHGVHLLQAAPFLVVLACPLMHLFGHHGHGGHKNHANHRSDEPPAPKS
ncbi:DUF2933 domain-containing protein [Piscinibacter sp.]|jgi:Flp pilus assembly protein TadB|uniref:DUF2933 domain-containing protein n=1 Tax=Piscinibacter sp. TaxID=1903157 RepID=UPI003559AF9F